MGHELLIIHGKYLEQMLLNEHHKNIRTINKYIPSPIEMIHFDKKLYTTPKEKNLGQSKI